VKKGSPFSDNPRARRWWATRRLTAVALDDLQRLAESAVGGQHQEEVAGDGGKFRFIKKVRNLTETHA
jgi:hypothetical protein